jgi:DNA-binding IclR family transcriptional regulator
VGVCVAIGHVDGKSFSAAKLAAYLDCPRTSVIRRLDALAKMEIIVRRGTRYYLNEPRVNSDSAIKSLSDTLYLRQLGSCPKRTLWNRDSGVRNY